MPNGPFKDAVVVVEGTNDVRAVTAAVRPLGGTMILKGSYNNKMGHYNVPSEVMALVAAAVEKAPPGGAVIVLTDSDTAGRQLRSRIVQDVPGCLHAFIGAHESSAAEETRYHRAGNVGVEHARPDVIRRALAAARPSSSSGGQAGITRDVFQREQLAEWGLCGPMGESAPDPKWKRFGGVAARRRLIGEYLGVGDCDAKQLIRQMNLFFTEEEVAAAVASLPKEGEAIPAKMTDGGSDKDTFVDTRKSAEPAFDMYAYVKPGQAPPGFK